MQYICIRKGLLDNIRSKLGHGQGDQGFGGVAQVDVAEGLSLLARLNIGIGKLPCSDFEEFASTPSMLPEVLIEIVMSSFGLRIVIVCVLKVINFLFRHRVIVVIVLCPPSRPSCLSLSDSMLQRYEPLGHVTSPHCRTPESILHRE